MNQDWLIPILTVFVGLVALSQLAQMVALIVMQRQVKALLQKVNEFTPKAEAVLQTARDTVEQARKQVADIGAKVTEIGSKASGILDSTRHQLTIVEGILTDVSSRAKVQLDRVEMVVDDTLGRVHQTVTTVHDGVMRPLKEINGVAAGVRAGVAHLLKGGRPSVAQVTHDEEMFI